MIAKVDVRNVFAGNASAERLDDGEETRIISVPSPSFERNRLDLSKPKRWFDGIQPNRQVRAPLPSPVGFVANEVALGTYGTPAPHNDDTFRRIQMFLDVLAPMSASADVGVPPDGKAFRFKRRDQRPKARAILSLVRNEYVCRANHCCPRNEAGTLCHVSQFTKFEDGCRWLAAGMGRKLPLRSGRIKAS